MRNSGGPSINATFTFGCPVKSKGALKVMVNDRIAQTSSSSLVNSKGDGKPVLNQLKKERKLKRPHKPSKEAEVLDLSVKRVVEMPTIFPSPLVNVGQNQLAVQPRSAGAESQSQFRDPYLLLSELLK